MKPRAGRPTKRMLTKYLCELAEESETITNDGTPLTKAKLLAELIWKKALGYIGKNDKGEDKWFRPESWAILLIWERLEGRVAQAVPEEKTGLTVGKKVSDLVRAKLNQGARKAAEG